MTIRLIDPTDRWDAEDGRAAVMAGQEVVVLSPLAVVLMDILADGALSYEPLAEALVQTVGPPPEGIEPAVWVRDTCSDLAELGLVEIVSGP